jgi:hypothetical protein
MSYQKDKFYKYLKSELKYEKPYNYCVVFLVPSFE